MSRPASTNPYCDALGISVPSLEAASKAADANTYSLFIVALLERGEPITLEEAARRFEAAGLAPADRALASLKKCKPGRPPVYRDGDFYALDPHDDDVDLWAFRLGLRPPRSAPLRVIKRATGPLPEPDRPLTIPNLDEAWRGGVPSGWSAQRTAICILDAHGRTMSPEEVIAFVGARSRRSPLSVESAKHWRRGAAIRAREDGFWQLDPSHDAVPAARNAVRERLNVVRRWAADRPDPALIEANRRRVERERAAHAERLSRMRRVLLHVFPSTQPEAVVLLDVGRRSITSFLGGNLAEAREMLANYDIIVGVGIRKLLQVLGFEPAGRRLGELGPPQKTRQLNRRGRSLKITMRLLVQGSCGISHPFGDARVLRGYLRDGKTAKLRRRLESDAKSLFALYQYGRLHGAVRLRWGFLDEMIPVPWAHRDEPTLYDLMARAFEERLPLKVVVGNAPGWENPWSRAERAYVAEEDQGWRRWLVDQNGYVIDREEVQLARLAEQE